jgi:hypothetical protein
MTIPRKTLRWALARFLLLWGFYPSTPARVGTPRRLCAAYRCQRLSIPVSAPHVNRSVVHAHSSEGSTATPTHRGVQHTPPNAHERKTVAQRLSPTLVYRYEPGISVHICSSGYRKSRGLSLCPHMPLLISLQFDSVRYRRPLYTATERSVFNR